MYKVFVVDDEVVVRESIRTQIAWEDTRFTLSGEASDGEMALSLIKDIQPDILLTDIRMPFMDGLQLAKIVKQTMPWIRVIILSGHDEFFYAQKAIGIGVQAYLLKPISVSELLDALESAATAIEGEAKARNSTASLQAMLKNTTFLNAQHLFTDILTGGVASGEVIERALAFGIALIAPRYIVVRIELSGHSGGQLLLAREILHNLAEADDGVWLSFGGVERIAAIIKGGSDEAVVERAYSFAQAVQHEIANNTELAASIGIGGSVSHLPSIPESYTQAGEIFKRLGSAMAGKIYSISDLLEIGAFVPENVPRKAQLRYATETDIPAIIEKLLEPLGEQTVLSALFADYLLMDMLITCAKLLKELHCDAESVLPETKNFSALPFKRSTREELDAAMRSILSRTFAARDAHAGMKYASLIRKAQAYIHENYADANISLQSVAAHVALSSNHFCTIFAQETGRTFIEYLTGVRIAQAKEGLADLSVRTSEVAYSVGYNDPRYFSYIFKKNTGLTPRDYRAQYAAK
ncbi:MAG: response regulator [Clostridiales bacterium]|nr:response regulator [Clostridiales bacterium]